MKLRSTIENIFGNKAFEHGLFYLHHGALRFELSLSGDAIEMFDVAFTKANEIASLAFSDEPNLYLCWSFYGNKSYLSSLSAFKHFLELEIPIPKTAETWCIKDEEDDDFYRHFLLFDIPRKLLKNAIWGAIAQDLGIRPKAGGSIYIVSINNSILLHPYDDRGMDLVSPNKQLMKMFYKTYNHYLLDYDRDTMNSVYKNF